MPLTTISYQLGYLDDSRDPVILASRQAVVDQHLTSLELKDTQIAAALEDAAATQVGDLKVDFQKQIGLLKEEGSRLLKNLAVLVGLPLRYDRFSGQVHPDLDSYTDKYRNPYKPTPDHIMNEAEYETLRNLQRRSSPGSVKSYW